MIVSTTRTVMLDGSVLIALSNMSVNGIRKNGLKGRQKEMQIERYQRRTTMSTEGTIGKIVMPETLVPVLRRLWVVPPVGGTNLIYSRSIHAPWLNAGNVGRKSKQDTLVLLV